MKTQLRFFQPLFALAVATVAATSAINASDTAPAGMVKLNPADFAEIPPVLRPTYADVSNVRNPEKRLVWHYPSKKLQKVRLVHDLWNNELYFIDDARNYFQIESDGSDSFQPIAPTPTLSRNYLGYRQYIEIFTQLNERLKTIREAIDSSVGYLHVGASIYPIRREKDGYLWTFNQKTKSKKELLAYLLLIYPDATVYSKRTKKCCCIPYSTKKIIS